MDLGGGNKAKINFAEYGHVTYQMKWKVVYNNMLANILPIYMPSTSGVVSKGQNIFS